MSNFTKTQAKAELARRAAPKGSPERICANTPGAKAAFDASGAELRAKAGVTAPAKKSTPAKAAAKTAPAKPAADPIKKLAAEYASARVPERGTAAWWAAYKTYTASVRAAKATAEVA